MATFQLRNVSCISVTGAHLDAPVLLEVHTADNDDQKRYQFFEARVSHKLARLLCTDGKKAWDFGKYVTVLDTMQHLRDEALRKVIGYTEKSAQKGYNKTQRAKALEEDGRMAEIKVPTIAGVEGISVMVLLDPPRSALRLQCTPEILQWLSAVVSAERAQEVTKEKVVKEEVAALRETRNDMGAKGVWVYSDGRVIATRKTDDDAADSPDQEKRSRHCQEKRQSVAGIHQSPDKVIETAVAFVEGNDDVTDRRTLRKKPRLIQANLAAFFGAGAPKKSDDSLSDTASTFELSSNAGSSNSA